MEKDKEAKEKIQKLKQQGLYKSRKRRQELDRKREKAKKGGSKASSESSKAKQLTVIEHKKSYHREEKIVSDQNKQWKKLINNVVQNNQDQVRSKGDSLLFQIFGWLPDYMKSVDQINHPFFFRDPGPTYSFENIFLMGIDVKLLIFNIYLFQFFDMIWLQSIVAAFFLSYALYEFIMHYRVEEGEDNISEKTKTPPQFLI